MNWKDLKQAGYKIIRWYQCKGSKIADHILCIGSSDELIIQWWKGGEYSNEIAFPASEAMEANKHVRELLLSAEAYKIRDREDIAKTLYLLGIGELFIRRTN